MKRVLLALGATFVVAAQAGALASRADGAQDTTEGAGAQDDDEAEDAESKQDGEDAPAPEETAEGRTGEQGDVEVAPGEAAANRDEPLASGALPRFDHPFTIDEIERSLAELARVAPEWVERRTIGTSRGGRSIQVLALTAPDTGDAAKKPALCIAGFGALGESFDAEAALAFASMLVERRSEPPFDALLADHVVLVAPALDPDARVDVPAGARDEAWRDRAKFDRNFPLGWEPSTVREDSGDAPLSEPETLTAARFFGSETNVALLVGVAGASARPGEPYEGAELPAADAAVFDTLAELVDASGGPELLPWNHSDSQGGRFHDYVFQAFGIYPVAWTSAPTEGGPAAIEAWARAVARGSGELLFALPRVRVSVDALESLGPNLWKLDVAVHNAGTLPTLSALGARRTANGELSLAIEGAKLIATARRHAPDAAYGAAAFHRDGARVELGGGIFVGGETRWVRLILEAEPGTVVAVRGDSVRGGSASLDVELTL